MRISKSKPLFEVHNNLSLAEKIMASWINGKQYVEIATECECSVEQAALYIDFIQRVIAVKAKAIVSYIKDAYRIESTQMQLWPDMVKRGVSNEKALWLVDSGLGDRILVNMLVAYFDVNFNDEYDNEILLYSVVHAKEVDRYVMESNIPILLKDQWKLYLGSTGVM